MSSTREENVNYIGSIIYAIVPHTIMPDVDLCSRWGFIHREVTRLTTGHACPSSWPSTKIYRTRERRIRCRGERPVYPRTTGRPCVNAVENVRMTNALCYQSRILRMQPREKKNRQVPVIRLTERTCVPSSSQSIEPRSAAGSRYHFYSWYLC